MMNDKKSSKKILIKVVLCILFISIILYSSIAVYSYTIISDYDDKIYPNVYVEEYDISNIQKEEITNYINSITQNIEQKIITFLANGKEYKISVKELGITLDEDNLSNRILTYSNNMNSFDKLKNIISKDKKIFNYELLYSTDTLAKYLENLKKQTDTKGVKGKLVMDKNRNLSYRNSMPAYNLDVNKSLELIEKKLDEIISSGRIELIGTSKKLEEDKLLSSIDTKVSSFSTTYNNKVSRAKNISNAASYLDGVILKPNEVFSFFKYAGPYHKKGYVYYDSTMGNGVCQVVSTIYNTALLGGLQIVERYSHERQMVYVPGALDATVAARGNYSKVDFKFKNNYDYPLYISAYTKNGKITIEFWSNSKAKEGKTYKTESVKIGYKAYKAYLVTYKDGKQVGRKLVNTTYYPK